MAALSLAVVALMHGVAAAAFLVVARTLGRRDVVPEDRLAAQAFVVWWAALGAYMVLRTGLTAYAVFTDPRPEVFLAARAVGIPLLVVSVWALVFHILYLFTGRRGLAVPLACFYAVVGAGFVVAGFVPRPDAVVVAKWHVALAGEGETVLYRSVYAVLGLSIIASALAYLTVLSRLTDRLQRLRVLLVAGSILLWVSSGLVAFMGTVDAAKFVALVVLGLGTAAAVLVAYHPPRGFVAWARGELPALRAARRREVQRRADALV